MNSLVSVLFTFVINLSCTVFLTTSLLTALLGLLKSIETVFNLSTSILSISAFELANLDIAANLDASTPADFLNQLLLDNWTNLIQL